MFPVNLALLAIVFAGYVFYRYVYPRKNPGKIVLLLFISLLPIVSIFRAGAYESGDFILHLYRVVDFYKAITEGIFIPSWAERLNASFGYPLFIFINPAPYYFISLFHGLGFSFIAGMKIFLASTYVLSGLFMFILVKRMYKNESAAFFSAIIYLFSPYHLIDQHFRVAVGEIAIFTTLPLLLYSIVRLSEKIKFANVLFVSLCTSIVILSHQAMAFFAIALSFFFTIYFLLRKKRIKKVLPYYIIATLCGVVAVFYSLYPYIIYNKYISSDSYSLVSFSRFQDILFSPYRYGLLLQGPEGQLSTIVGYAQIFVLISSIVYFARKKTGKQAKDLLFYLMLIAILIFLILPLSEPVWQTIPLVRLLIISSRMLLFISVFISLLSAVFYLSVLKKRQFLASMLLILAITTSILNWGSRGMVHIDDKTISSQAPTSTSQGEGWGIGIPKWIGKSGFEKVVPTSQAEIVKGKGTIKNSTRTSTSHVYVVASDEPLEILENTWYFPGWNAYIDNRTTSIRYTEKDHLGKMIIPVPSGLHKIEVIYRDLPPHAALKQISILFFVFVIVFYFFVFLKRISRRFGKSKLFAHR